MDAVSPSSDSDEVVRSASLECGCDVSVLDEDDDLCICRFDQPDDQCPFQHAKGDRLIVPRRTVHSSAFARLSAS